MDMKIYLLKPNLIDFDWKSYFASFFKHEFIAMPV